MKFKKIAVILMLCASVALLPACQILKEADTEESVVETTLPIFSVGEIATTNDFEFSVSDIYSFTATTPNGDSQDYIVVSVAYTNLTEQSQKIGRRDIDNNLFTEFCPNMVANAVEILEQIIEEQEV